MRRRQPFAARDSGKSGTSTVAIGFVTGLLSGYLARGADPTKLLEKCGINPDQLDVREARVPLASYASLYSLVAAALEDEAFGLFSTPMRTGSFEFLTRSVISSATLDEALQRGARFLRLVLPDLELLIARTDHTACIEIRETRRIWSQADDARRIFAFEWLLRLIHSLACWLVDRTIHLDAVTFPYPRPFHAPDYASIYTAQATFTGA